MCPVAQIPLLGQLFKSRAENKSKTELVVLVSPEVVDPLNPGEALPVPVMPREFMGPVIEPKSMPAAKPSKKAPAKKPVSSNRPPAADGNAAATPAGN